MPLTDKLRAAVFARDKGICAFSGLSVWMLDYGATPLSHPDWPDHIKPVSRGGKDTLDNLVCASYFYNRKKLNNGSDRSYLFGEGRPTETFFWTFGELSQEQALLLRQHAGLTETDWYFNRALFNVMVAIRHEAGGIKAVRDRGYWLASAHKRLVTWRSLTGGSDGSSFVARGLVRYPSAPDVKLMLSLTATDEPALLAVYRRLLMHYRANLSILDRFTRARNDEARAAATRHKVGLATEPLIAPLKLTAARLSASV